MEDRHPLWGYFIDIIETIVVAAAIFVVVYLFLLQPHQVRGSSMEPNLSDGQYILTDKISYRFDDPRRGDIVIFKAPVDENFDYIKRIIALPGETISIIDGEIIIKNDDNPQGFKLEEPYSINGAISPGTQLSNGVEIKMEEDRYFVFGDNRNQSFDSREWGKLPRENIIGKGWLRYWPLSEISIIKRVNFTQQ